MAILFHVACISFQTSSELLMILKFIIAFEKTKPTFVLLCFFKK